MSLRRAWVLFLAYIGTVFAVAGVTRLYTDDMPFWLAIPILVSLTFGGLWFALWQLAR